MTCTSSKNVLAAGFAAWIGLAAWSLEAQLPVQPDVLMSRVTTEVIAILKRDTAAGQPTEVVRLVETKILPLFDFQHLTRIAVARHWRLARRAGEVRGAPARRRAPEHRLQHGEHRGGLERSTT